jgi:hypothetical protein
VPQVIRARATVWRRAAAGVVTIWRRDENIVFHILGYLAPVSDPLRLRLVLRPQCSGSKSTYVSDKKGDL